MTTQVRLYIAGLVLAAAIAGLLYVHHLQRANHTLKTQVVTATVQADVNQQGAVINDRKAAAVAKTHRKAEEGRDAIQQSTDLDRALGEYGAAIDSVREQGHAPAQPEAATDGRRSNPGRRPEAT